MAGEGLTGLLAGEGLIGSCFQVTEKYKGLAITPKELQHFMIEEQVDVTNF